VKWTARLRGRVKCVIAAGTSTERVQRDLDWNEKTRGAVIVKRTCGALVCLGGLYLVYTAH